MSKDMAIAKVGQSKVQSSANESFFINWVAFATQDNFGA